MTKKTIVLFWKLLVQRRFSPLIITQFWGAFNDNLLKQAIILEIVFGDAASSIAQTTPLAAMAIGFFILPFLLFSPLAGVLADHHDKARLTRFIKGAEILLAILAGMALLYGNLASFFVVLFLMGTQSTFFGPIKYALIPTYLKKEELLGGNALTQAASFIAILMGTLLGGVLIIQEDGASKVAFSMVAVALMGYIASLFLLPAPPAVTPRKNPMVSWTPIREALHLLANDKKLLYAIIAISLFFLPASIIVTQLPSFVQSVLGGDETIANALFAVFALGIVFGSLSIRLLLKETISLSYAPYGLWILSLFLADAASLHFSDPIVPREAIGSVGDLFTFPYLRITVDFFFMAAGASFYVVPCYALLQISSPDDNRARIIALSNVSDALLIVTGAILTMLLLSFSVAHLFLLVALVNLCTIFLIQKLHAMT